MIEIDGERGRIQNEIARKRNELESRQRDFLYKLQSAVDSYRYDRDELNEKKTMLRYAQEELEELIEQHDIDRANY